jgi:hypothetical protein
MAFDRTKGERPDHRLGGFPWGCYHNHCSTPVDCVMFGCIKDIGPPPRSTRSTTEVLYAKSGYVAPDQDPA